MGWFLLGLGLGLAIAYPQDAVQIIQVGLNTAHTAMVQAFAWVQTHQGA